MLFSIRLVELMGRVNNSKLMIMFIYLIVFLVLSYLCYSFSILNNLKPSLNVIKINSNQNNNNNNNNDKNGLINRTVDLKLTEEEEKNDNNKKNLKLVKDKSSSTKKSWLMEVYKNVFMPSDTFGIFEHVVAVVSSCLVMFGGVVPYMPQYRIIYKSRDARGFSSFVCLTILVANILRIFFWFGHPYELPILIQSVIMILCMLIMLELCVRVNTESDLKLTDGSANREIRKLTDFKWRNFWRWDHFASYLQFILIFVAIGGLLTQIFIQTPAFIETLGFFSVFIEAMLPAPQLYRNFVNKSTHGMSIIMVSMWTSGDTFKVVYYLLRKSPIQFWTCGILQVSLDVGILIQVCFYYALNRSTYSGYQQI